jgi:hypothetical protein
VQGCGRVSYRSSLDPLARRLAADLSDRLVRVVRVVRVLGVAIVFLFATVMAAFCVAGATIDWADEGPMTVRCVTR